MHEPHPPTASRLAAPQAARIEFARRDLQQAREADLATMEPAALILLVERLRTRLDDTLRLLDETST